MQENELQETVRAYLDAFEARDLPRCMDFYADDAEILFQSSCYKGKSNIEEWHRHRFAADLRLARLDRIVVNGDAVIIEAVATSNRLRAWKIPSISGVITVVFDGSKVKKVTFGVRTEEDLDTFYEGGETL